MITGCKIMKKNRKKAEKKLKFLRLPPIYYYGTFRKHLLLSPSVKNLNKAAIFATFLLKFNLFLPIA